MVWALVAKFIARQPPLVQAAVLGLCVGLFISAAAQANQRDPLIGAVVLQVVVAGVIAATLFFLGLRWEGRQHGRTQSGWQYGIYTLGWLSGLSTALLALFGEGGLKVAALAIVPLVLLAAPAFQGFRLMLARGFG